MRAFSQSQALVAESVLLDSRLALYHEQENWLAIADVHFGAGLRLKFPALVQESGCWILPAFSPWAPGTEWVEREQGRIWLCTPNRILLVDREGLLGGSSSHASLARTSMLI